MRQKLHADGERRPRETNISTSLNTAKPRIKVLQVDLSNYDYYRIFREAGQFAEPVGCFRSECWNLTTKFEVVNVIGAVLLGLGVLPKLQESAVKYCVQGRLTFVGSDLQYVAKFKEKDTSGKLFEALKAKEGADMDDMSFQSAIPRVRFY